MLPLFKSHFLNGASTFFYSFMKFAHVFMKVILWQW